MSKWTTAAIDRAIKDALAERPEVKAWRRLQGLAQMHGFEVRRDACGDCVYLHRPLRTGVQFEHVIDGKRWLATTQRGGDVEEFVGEAVNAYEVVRKELGL